MRRLCCVLAFALAPLAAVAQTSFPAASVNPNNAFAVAAEQAAATAQNQMIYPGVNALANAAGQQAAQGVTSLAAAQGAPSGAPVGPNSLWPVQPGQTTTQGGSAGTTTPVAAAQQAQPPSTQNAKPPLDSGEAEALMWGIDPVQDLRQSGQSIKQGRHHGTFDSTDRASQVRMEEWRQELLERNVASESRIFFEARRLDRDAFALWASRLIWEDNARRAARAAQAPPAPEALSTGAVSVPVRSEGGTSECTCGNATTYPMRP